MTTGSAISGWGAALPPHAVTNEALTSALDTNDQWISERSGIRSRRAATGPFTAVEGDPAGVAAASTTGRLATEAARRAMDRADVRGGEVGMLLLCTTTPDRQVPASSSEVASALQIAGGAMDINAACSGFVYGLATAVGLISVGMGPVVVVGAETLSRITDWSDRSSAFLFGDGAGAVVVKPARGACSLLGSDLGVDGGLAHLLVAEHGGKIRMNGREIYRNAVKITVDSARIAMARAGVTSEDVDLFVPHQANARIIEAVADRLGISGDRVALTIEWTGNTSAASIPIALAIAAESGRLHDGAIVLLSGFGAGMTWGSVVWRWGR